MKKKLKQNIQSFVQLLSPFYLFLQVKSEFSDVHYL